MAGATYAQVDGIAECRQQGLGICLRRATIERTADQQRRNVTLRRRAERLAKIRQPEPIADHRKRKVQRVAEHAVLCLRLDCGASMRALSGSNIHRQRHGTELAELLAHGKHHGCQQVVVPSVGIA